MKIIQNIWESTHNTLALPIMVVAMLLAIGGIVWLKNQRKDYPSLKLDLTVIGCIIGAGWTVAITIIALNPPKNKLKPNSVTHVSNADTIQKPNR